MKSRSAMTTPSPRPERFAQQRAIGCNDRREATARDRADLAARVLHDLRLLLRVQPCRCANDEAPGFQRMLPDIDFRLLGKRLAEHRARIHSRMDLLAAGHHRVARQRIVCSQLEGKELVYLSKA